MKRFMKSHTIATGLAMFSMFFGAGNVFFPLLLGQEAGEKNIYAILGLLITAILVPFLGVLSIVLFGGDYKSFFYRLGKVPGSCLMILILSLLGPFGATPRCITLSHATFQYSCLGLPLWLFSLIACLLIYLFAYKKRQIVSLLGYVLTPLLLISLTIIIVKGLYNPPPAAPNPSPSGEVFMHGLREGYNTMDLLAAFFFSSIVLDSLRKTFGACNKQDNRQLMLKTVQAGLIGCGLLLVIYAGMSFVTSYYGNRIEQVDSGEILAALAFKLLGSWAGIVASLATALACLTTAVTLVVIFAEFLQQYIFKGKVKYQICLIGTLIITYFFSYLTFSGIVKVVAPIVIICYPALIALCILNMAHKLFNLKIVKTPVLCVFLISLYFTIFT